MIRAMIREALTPSTIGEAAALAAFAFVVIVCFA